MFIRFDRIYERDGHTHIDRQTDGQTPHGDIGRACIASRGKNHMHGHGHKPGKNALELQTPSLPRGHLSPAFIARYNCGDASTL